MKEDKKKLIKGLKVTKPQLYKKYKAYIDLLDKGFNEIDAAAIIFEVEPTIKHRPALFYLIIGLRSMQSEMIESMENILTVENKT